MNAVGEMIPRRLADTRSGDAPCVAIVTPHKATFSKPLYDAFAGAQPEPWRTLMVWPEGHRSEHPDPLVTPTGENVRVERVGCRHIGRTFLPGKRLWHRLRLANPRMILVQEYSPFSLAGLAFARRHRIPVAVLTEVGVRNRHFFSAKTRLWHGFWSRFVNGIVAACPAAHDPLSGRRLPSIAAYHAVDARLYQPVTKEDRDTVIFAYLGQLIPRKGLDLWVKAAHLLRQSGHENFQMRIIGGGDEAWLRGLISAAGLDDKVEWRGFLSGESLRHALGSADVFVLPTRQDTYAAVVHEAACLALPLLVSEHAGAAEALVRDGENGFVLDPENTVGFAQRMRLLLEPSLRARMSEASRVAGEQLSAHVRGAALWRWMETNFLAGAACQGAISKS